MSLGKGFYEFTFSLIEDVKRVRSVASWNLNPGLLKLFAWTKDFNPSTQQQSSAQVWVRFYALSQEYWHPKILFAIARSIGSPICTDAVTNKAMIDRTFGHFVRVLVDLDLSQELRYKVLVERKGFAFFVDLDYENMPDFCNSDKIVGHRVGTEKGKDAWKEKNRVVVELDESPSSSKNHVGGDDAHAAHTLENGLAVNEQSNANS
ncbi:uncharacterized protein LOC131647592 [Vicia villosa]|uniref:uncharacterized protein LOC131647592 n=1 Tax=Vicia villosa TaxID=3911 RepID=UPI00273B92F1|nr:uncharacterized protein LOC131647592 [Vicia villosa]